VGMGIGREERKARSWERMERREREGEEMKERQ